MAQDGEDLTKYNVHTLMALQEDVRIKYCIDTMMAVADGLEQVTKIKGKIAQVKAMKKFLKSLREKKEEIMTPIIYTIKPEFRDAYMDLLQRFSDSLESI